MRRKKIDSHLAPKRWHSDYSYLIHRGGRLHKGGRHGSFSHTIMSHDFPLGMTVIYDEDWLTQVLVNGWMMTDVQDADVNLFVFSISRQ